MTYILMIWTVVAVAGDHHGIGAKVADWRPLAEFHDSNIPPQLAQDKCEAAAKQLGLKSENYRCIRNK